MQIEDKGSGNIVSGTASVKSQCKIVIHSNNCRINFGPDVEFWNNFELHMFRDNQVFELQGKNRLCGQFFMHGARCRVVLGKGTRGNRLWANMAEADSSIIFGEDCLFAVVNMRTSDSHRIFDIQTGERINPAGDIIVGDHVWIADDTLLLKGAEIGSGSVVGAKSMVNSKVPPNSLVAGVPAKVLRSGIRWEE